MYLWVDDFIDILKVKKWLWKLRKKLVLVIIIWSCEVNGYCKVYLSFEKNRYFKIRIKVMEKCGNIVFYLINICNIFL